MLQDNFDLRIGRTESNRFKLQGNRRYAFVSLRTGEIRF